MFQDFYTKTQKEIISLTKKFLENDFFFTFPKWKGKISILIEGSVANGRYDKFSDIDLKILVSEFLQNTYTREQIKAYKTHLQERKEPIQLHTPETYEQLQLKLSDWSQDSALRELSKALIVVDPEGKIKEIKKQFRWYPKPIFKEKLHWLIAEATFEFKERYEIAQKRHDSFFGEVAKLNSMRYLLNACLLTTKTYPSFDKHLFKEIQALKQLPSSIFKTSKALTQTHNLDEVSGLLKQLFASVETYLIKKKHITKHDPHYWIDLRPKNKVRFE